MNTSKTLSKKVISADEAGSIERWQTPVVEQSLPGGEAQVSFGPITAEAIEKIQKQAYKEAYDEGLTKGYKDGLAKATAQLDPQIQLLNKAMSALSEPFAQLDQEVEQQLTELAITIARQLVRREIKTDPGQIIAIVREAILALPSATKKTYVYLHPEDMELVKTKLSASEPESYWRLMEDPTLSRGDCKVMTDTSTIDATVERRLSSLVANLLGGEREQDSSDV
ncbi:flagellar assembly protein FliH [Kaarinaea lacus]